MRRFNNKEKKLLSEIAHGDRRQHLYRYMQFDFLTGNRGIVIDHEENRMYAAAPPEEEVLKEMEILFSWRDEIIDLLLLLKLLLEEKYIIPYPNNKYQQKEAKPKILLCQGRLSRLIEETQKELYKSALPASINIDENIILFIRREIEKVHHFPEYEHVKLVNEKGEFRFRTVEIPREFYVFIEDNLLGEFVVTEDLVDYVENDFRSREEIRHSRNIVLTYISIGVALFVGLMAIVLQIRSSKQTDNFILICFIMKYLE